MKPIVGRERELAAIAQMRAQAGLGKGAVLLVSGDSGVGKTRLLAELSGPARDAGWQVMDGSAYALEAAIPYAPFADACEPTITRIDANQLVRLTRGDRRVVTTLAPGLTDASASAANERAASGSSVAELQVRLHAGILQLLVRLSERQPVLLVLENLQWADTSSLELLHFLARQVHAHRILLVGTWNETERELPEALRTMVRSLRSLGIANHLQLEPLSRATLAEWLTHRFEVEEASVQQFIDALHDTTRGNPFFAEQTLEELIASGTLRRSGGVWVGWQAEQIVLPRSVKDVLQARLHRLSPEASHVAGFVAVSGSAVDHHVLLWAARRAGSTHTIGESDIALDGRAPADESVPTESLDHDLITGLDELRAQGIVVERLEQGGIMYDLVHPMLRLAILDILGLARARGMHAYIATALESVHGERASRYAEQIAAHWRRADPRVNARSAVHWLLQAGHQAKERLARREAALALQAALDRADEYPDLVDEDTVRVLLDELSRLYRRLGEYALVVGMCERARDLALARGDNIGVAVSERRLGLAYEGLGRRVEALEHYDAGILRATTAGDQMLVVRLHLAKGDSLQALGQPDEARRAIAQALDLAEQGGDVALLARAHRALLKVHTWSGPAHRAWAHARSAVEFAERCDAPNLLWSAHWSAAVLGAFSASSSALIHHLEQATRLADELRSPLLKLRTLEIAIEFRSCTGEWDRALVDGTRAIADARAIDQPSMLVRLLYWVGTMQLYRGDRDEAGRLFAEAWKVADADAVNIDQPLEIHRLLPAYSARIQWLVGTGDHRAALELGHTALMITERTGTVGWAVYRLIPAIAHSAVVLKDTPTLQLLRDQLARYATQLSHTIGRGWVSVLDGELAIQSGNLEAAVVDLQLAIATLEAVPVPFDAAHARIRLAVVLGRQGETDEAAREARSALEVFEKLGAAPSADDARAFLHSIGARFPTQHATGGLDGLTGREQEIVQLVAQRLANKEIGARLQISARTVGTHLANIFDKVGVRDRTALGDLAREQERHRA